MSKLKELTKKIPLKTRLEVAIQAHYITKLKGSLFIQHDKQGNEIIPEQNQKAFEEAQPILKIINEEIDQWEIDGRP